MKRTIVLYHVVSKVTKMSTFFQAADFDELRPLLVACRLLKSTLANKVRSFVLSFVTVFFINYRNNGDSRTRQPEGCRSGMTDLIKNHVYPTVKCCFVL